jgi:hypothetical protein
VAEPTWGDEVVVVADAPAPYRPGSRAWVVGLRDDPSATGQKLLTIEFEDGSSVDVPDASVEMP